MYGSKSGERVSCSLIYKGWVSYFIDRFRSDLRDRALCRNCMRIEGSSRVSRSSRSIPGTSRVSKTLDSPRHQWRRANFARSSHTPVTRSTMSLSSSMLRLVLSDTYSCRQLPPLRRPISLLARSLSRSSPGLQLDTIPTGHTCPKLGRRAILSNIAFRPSIQSPPFGFQIVHHRTRKVSSAKEAFDAF